MDTEKQDYTVTVTGGANQNKPLKFTCEAKFDALRLALVWLKKNWIVTITDNSTGQSI